MLFFPFTRLASTPGTTKPRQTEHGNAQKATSNAYWKDTKSHSSLLGKLKSLMHLPKTHPVSISDELSGGSKRYFGGGGGVFGSSSEFQEGTGLF